MIYDDTEAWVKTDSEDLWVYDKLILSKKLHYNCGPVGVDVPDSGLYCVRPITNMLGMGRGMQAIGLRKSTDHLPLGHFWCSYFEGRHCTVDYHNGQQVNCYQGIRGRHNPFWKWDRWVKTAIPFQYPEILKTLKGNYKYINCEFIGPRLIEIHLRSNPDSKYNSNVLFPVWLGDSLTPPKGMKFVEDPDYKRVGFFINE